MFNFSLIIFVIGWVLWFLIDKHPASLGTVLPEEADAMLDNFQMAFDMLTAGFLRASYVFIWKAHYLVISVIAALLFSAIYQAVSNIFRRRRLREIMWPKKTPSDALPIVRQSEDRSPSDRSQSDRLGK